MCPEIEGERERGREEERERGREGERERGREGGRERGGIQTDRQTALRLGYNNSPLVPYNTD